MKKTPIFHVLALLFVSAQQLFGQVSVSPNPRIYEKVTLTITTSTALTEATQTFRDYRMNVTIEGPGQSLQVPAYFAADGDAANSSATTGSVWRAHFLPLQPGTYTYTVSFRTGQSVAASLDGQAGSPLSPDGASGSFTVGAQPSDEGFLSRGKLEYVNETVARFTDGSYFLEVGADSPETFLEYTEFDGTDSDRSYPVHIPQWNTGDPTWQGDKGRGIIGVVNYLASQGMNVHYFLTMNVEGDGKQAYPFTGPTNILTYDVSKLDQWQIVFDFMMRKGVAVEFVLLETENLNYFEDQSRVDRTVFSDARKIYYREMIARFGYLNALVYNIAEESNWDSGGDQFTAEQIEEAATFIKQLSPYNDLISVHNGPSNNDQIFGQLLDLPGNTPLTALSVQGNYANASVGHGRMLNWLNASRQAGTPWVVRYTEPFSSSANPDLEDWTDSSLWAAFMAGAPGVHYYHGGGQDVNNEDYTQNQAFFERMRFTREFFVNNDIPFQDLLNRNELIGEGYLLTDEQDYYIAFLPSGGNTTVQLPAGDYEQGWYSPRDGGNLQGSRSLTSTGSVEMGNPPAEPGQSWAILFRRTDGGGGDPGGEEPGNCDADYAEENGLVVIEAENIDQDAWPVLSEVSGFSGDGYIEWGQGNFFNQPGNGLISVQIEITQTGEYAFIWRSKVGEGTNPTENNDSWLRFPDADAFFARKGDEVIYPKGSGLTPNPEGAGADGWFKVYSSGTTDWTWSTRTSDNDAHEIFVRFDQPGVYTMEISGRSNAHFIDRIVLFQDIQDPRDLELEETPCTATDPVGVSGVSLTPPTLVLEVGQQSSLTAEVIPSNATNKAVSWSSDNTSVAVVDATGRVTAIAPGNAVIRVETEDGGFTDSTSVQVNASDPNVISVRGVTILPASLELRVGDMATLNAVISPANATNANVVWSVDDEEIAAIDAEGNVEALATGGTILRVRTEDGGFTDSIQLVVLSADGMQGEIITAIRFDASSIELSPGESVQVEVTVDPVEASPSNLVWSSTDTGIAEVSSQGLVTGIQPGLVNVRATDASGTLESTIRVNVKDYVLAIAPNPMRPGDALIMGGLPDGTYNLIIYSMEGKQLRSEPVSLQAGFALDTEQLKTGTYIIVLENQLGSYTATLVVQ